VTQDLDKRKAPPYARYAFLNPYNLSLLGGAAAMAAATGHVWIGALAAASEVVWMLFAPDSRLLRKTWFDRRWQEEQRALRKQRQIEKFSALPDVEKVRALSLRELQERIQKLAADNPSFTAELLRDDLSRLDVLVDDFLDLAAVGNRYEDYLRTFNLQEIEEDLRRYELQADKLPEGDERYNVAKKNLQVLLQRKDRYKELRRNLTTVRGQMDLMENTFRLLADEIVTMQSPSELGERLEQMREGVEAARQTARETERFLQAVER
jgi:hypothetical protein